MSREKKSALMKERWHVKNFDLAELHGCVWRVFFRNNCNIIIIIWTYIEKALKPNFKSTKFDVSFQLAAEFSNKFWCIYSKFCLISFVKLPNFECKSPDIKLEWLKTLFLKSVTPYNWILSVQKYAKIKITYGIPWHWTNE